MCGLVGVAGTLEARDEQLLKRLLVFDTPRGLDATGFARLSNAGVVNVCKIASHPFDLFGMTAFTSALSGYNSQVFLGHNRAATTGAKTSYNAHPFQFGHIVGAHNGTLDKASWERLEEKVGEKFDVDSAAIFACIAKFGIEETIPLMEEGRTSGTGAWALTWFNTEDETFNFIRNKHRPLWYAYTEDFKKIIWASEYKMIDAALSMSNSPYKMFKTKEDHLYFSAKENTLYSFDLETLRKGSDTRPKAQVKELKGREPAPVVAPKAQPPFGGGRHTVTNIMGHSSTSHGVPEHIQIQTTLVEPLLGVMDRDHFKDIATLGCCMCNNPVSIDDTSFTVFEDEDLVMCGDCSGNTGIRVYLPPRKFMDLHKKERQKTN
jgi:predicted glutamine amidotransferase